MSLLTMPFTKVARIRGRTLMNAATAQRLAFSGVAPVVDWLTDWWRYDIEMAIAQGAEGRAISAFFTALGGARNSFLFADPSAINTAALGSPSVAGASQTGDTLATDGWNAGAVLEAGRCISLGSGAATRFHMVTADATADGVGAMSIPIVPPLRASPADNDPVEYANPSVRLRLTSPVPTAVSPADIYRITFTAEEVL